MKLSFRFCKIRPAFKLNMIINLLFCFKVIKQTKMERTKINVSQSKEHFLAGLADLKSDLIDSRTIESISKSIDENPRPQNVITDLLDFFKTQSLHQNLSIKPFLHKLLDTVSQQMLSLMISGSGLIQRLMIRFAEYCYKVEAYLAGKTVVETLLDHDPTNMFGLSLGYRLYEAQEDMVKANQLAKRAVQQSCNNLKAYLQFNRMLSFFRKCEDRESIAHCQAKLQIFLKLVTKILNEIPQQFPNLYKKIEEHKLVFKPAIDHPVLYLNKLMNEFTFVTELEGIGLLRVLESEANSKSVIMAELNVEYLKNQKRYKEMAAQSQKLSHIATGDSDNYANLALAFDRLGHLKQAKQTFEQALSITPNDPEILKDYAICLGKNKEFQRSEDIFHKIFELDPDNQLHTFDYAKLLINWGRNQEALQILESATCKKFIQKSTLYKSGIYSFLGQAFSNSNAALSKKIFRASLQQNNSNLMALQGFAQEKLKEGNIEESLNIFEACLQFEPHSFQILSFLGSIHLHKKNMAEALSFFQRGLKINPNSYHILGNLALISYQNNDIDQALEYFQRAFLLHPDQLEMYVNFAIIINEQKNSKFKNKIDNIISVHKLHHSEDIDINFNLVTFYYIIQDFSSAAVCLSQALEILRRRENHSNRHLQIFMNKSILSFKQVARYCPKLDCKMIMLSGIVYRMMRKDEKSLQFFNLIVNRYKSNDRTMKSSKLMEAVATSVNNSSQNKLSKLFQAIFESQLKSINTENQIIFCEFLLSHLFEIDSLEAIQSYLYLSRQVPPVTLREQFALLLFRNQDKKIDQICRVAMQYHNIVFNKGKLSQNDTFAPEAVRFLNNIIQINILKKFFSQIRNINKSESHLISNLQNIKARIKKMMVGKYCLKQMPKKIEIYYAIINQIIEQERYADTIQFQTSQMLKQIRQNVDKLPNQIACLEIYILQKYPVNQFIKLLFSYIAPLLFDSQEGPRQLSLLLTNIKSTGVIDPLHLRLQLENLFSEQRELSKMRSISQSEYSLVLDQHFQTQIVQEQALNNLEFTVVDVEIKRKRRVSEDHFDHKNTNSQNEQHMAISKMLQSLGIDQLSPHRMTPNFFSKGTTIKAQIGDNLSQEKAIEDIIILNQSSFISQSDFVFRDKDIELFSQSAQQVRSLSKLPENQLLGRTLFIYRLHLFQWLGTIKTNYLIQHYFNPILIRYQNQTMKDRVVSYSRGTIQSDKICSGYFRIAGQDQRLACILWESGESHIFNWLRNTSEGISQLQQRGLYHMHLNFASIAKIGDQYRITDLRQCLKYELEEDVKIENRILEGTRQMLVCWLNSQQKILNKKESKYNLILPFIFGGNDSLLEELQFIKANPQFEAIHKKVNRCLRLLKAYAKHSHLLQIKKMVFQLLSPQIEAIFEKQSIVSHAKVVKILQTFTLLEKGEITYSQFSHKLQIIETSKKNCQVNPSPEIISEIESIHSSCVLKSEEKLCYDPSKESSFESSSYGFKIQLDTINSCSVGKMLIEFQFNFISQNKALADFLSWKFKLNLFLIQMISAYQLESIARYYSSNARLRGENESYQVMMEKGQKEYSLKYFGNSGAAEIDILLKLGRKYIFCWMVSLAKIIVSLQAIGIYHPDLTFRNTIKLGEVFLCIDFDNAYQLSPTKCRSQQQSPYLATQKMIQIWLQSSISENEELDSAFISIFKRVSKDKWNQLQQIRNQFIKEGRSCTAYKKAETDVMELMRRHMKDDHYHLFRSLILELTNQTHSHLYFNGLNQNDCQNLAKILQKSNQDAQFDYHMFTELANNLYLNHSQEQLELEHHKNQFITTFSEKWRQHQQFYSFLFQKELGITKKLFSINKVSSNIAFEFKQLIIQKIRIIIELLAKAKPEYIVRHYFDCKKQLKQPKSEGTSEIIAVTRNDYYELMNRQSILVLNNKRYIYSFIISLTYIINQIQQLGLACSHLSYRTFVRQAESFKLNALQQLWQFDIANSLSSQIIEIGEKIQAVSLQIVEQLLNKIQNSILTSQIQIKKRRLKDIIGEFSEQQFDKMLEMQKSRKITKIKKIFSKITKRNHLQQFLTLVEDLLQCGSIKNEKGDSLMSIFELNRIKDMLKQMRSQNLSYSQLRGRLEALIRYELSSYAPHMVVKLSTI